MTNLQRIRKERGLTQAALARAAGINARMIAFYDNGYRKINGAAAETVIRIADALGCDPRELMEKGGEQDE